MPGPKGKSFSDEQNARIRDAAKRLLDRYRTTVALAKELGVAQPTVSNFLSGKNGAGPEIALKIAAASGMSLDELIGSEPGDGRRPTFGGLPGWPEAEAEARPMRRAASDLDWARARALSGLGTPQRADLDFVLKAIDLVRDWPHEDTPETTAAKAEIAAHRAKAERRIKKGAAK